MTDEEKIEAAAKKAGDAARKKATAEADKKSKDAIAKKKRAADAKARKKAKTEADTKAKHTQALRELTPLAKEINVRMGKFVTGVDKANDHRLAAAIEMDKAKVVCEKSKISFKSWCEENIDQSYENARQLAAVGGAKNPALALEDLRGKNKKANVKARAKGTGKGKGTGSRDPKNTGPVETPETRAIRAFDAMDERAAENLISSKADDLGMVLVSREKAAASKAAKPAVAAVVGVEGLQKAFTNLIPSERMAFIQWAAEEVGVTLQDGFETPSEEDDQAARMDIPEALRRTKK